MKSFARAFLAVLFSLAGCGGDTPKLEVPQYSEMRNVQDAPAPIREAARAIVKIDLPEGHGTGTFISTEGLLLTNNHVLGVDKNACDLDGCYIAIHINFEIGTGYTPAVTVYAQPISASPEGDASLFQLYTNASKTTKVTSPHYLKINPVSGTDLLHKTVYVVGHPLAGLKKWTSGRVFGQNAKWILSTNFSLPGNSGSPFLDEEGRIVGIVHHAGGSAEDIARKSVRVISTGTPGIYLQEFIKAPQRLTLFYSIKSPHKPDEVVENHEAYLMAREGEALLVGGGRKPVLDVLGEKCDEVLKLPQPTSPEALNTRLVSCSTAREWINCDDPSNTPGVKKCPLGADKDKWNERFEKAAEVTEQYNQTRSVDFLLSAAQLETSAAQATAVAQAKLATYTTRQGRPPSLDLVTRWLSYFGPKTPYQGHDTVTYLVNYQQQIHYEYYFNSIIHGHALLNNLRVLKWNELVKAFAVMFEDEKLDLANKLSLEATCYMSGLF